MAEDNFAMGYALGQDSNGGNCNNGLHVGADYLNLNNGAGNANWNIGASNFLSYVGAFNQMQPIFHATRRKSFRYRVG